MSDQKIVAYAVYDIDVDEGSAHKVDISSIKDAQLQLFINSMAHDTSVNESSRKAVFEESSYAKHAFDELAETDSLEKLDELARQLLVAEKSTNKKIEHLDKKITAGNLIVAKVKRMNDTFILAAKIEFSSYLERKTFLLELGLPTKKAVLRTCFIEVVDNQCSDVITLYGTSGVIPAFWHAEFLNCKFTRNDSLNTKSAFKLIESKISYIRDISIDDHIDIRDCLIGYFKGNENFKFDDLVETLTEKYQPTSKEVDLKELKTKLVNLKALDKFDGSFTIDKKEVRARVKRRYPLDNDVVVVTNSGTSNVFKTHKNDKNYVVIETSTVPKDFKNIDF